MRICDVCKKEHSLERPVRDRHVRIEKIGFVDEHVRHGIVFSFDACEVCACRVALAIESSAKAAIEGITQVYTESSL